MAKSYEIGFAAVEMANTNIDSSCNDDYIGIVSYKLHGFNNSRNYLTDMCNNPDIFIIAVQEHWLSPSNLHFLGIHPDFTCYAISSMSQLMSGVFRGRPFGGVAFFCRKTIAGNIQVIANDDNSRCLCLSLKYDNYKLIKLLTVYLPCYESGPDYYNE